MTIQVLSRKAAARRAGAAGRAFTLVELLVVIGIVAILIGLLFPVISRSWALARFAKCKANLHAQLQAHHLYADDNRGLKPPLVRITSLSFSSDFVSPDVQWDGAPVGHGLLLGKYLPTIDALLCPSEALQDDVERDREAWEQRDTRPAATSGCSYVYYWRARPDPAPYPPPPYWKGVTYEFASRNGWGALALDINAEPGHRYYGEYENRAWINHPRIRRLNVAFWDNSVQDFPVDEVMLRRPAGLDDELRWIDSANRAKAGRPAETLP